MQPRAAATRSLFVVQTFHEQGEGLAAVERVLQPEAIGSIALETEGIAALTLRALRGEDQRVALPAPARGRHWREAHRIHPVPGVVLRLGVVAEHPVPAEHRLAVLLLDVLLDH